MEQPGIKLPKPTYPLTKEPRFEGGDTEVLATSEPYHLNITPKEWPGPYRPPWELESDRDQVIELVVRVPTFGRSKDRLRTAYSVARSISLSVNSQAQVFLEGELVAYDKVTDDGEEPPGYDIKVLPPWRR